MTWSRIHSAPLRVLPKPRPASSSQVRQSPFGACWLGRPHPPQSCSIASRSRSLVCFRNAASCSGGSDASNSAHETRLSPVLSRRLLAQEIEQQRNDLLRLLLLHPVPGAVEQLAADHAGADLLRAFESARRLVDAPVAHSADEDRWHVDRAPGK